MVENKLPLSIVILTHRSDDRFERSLQSAQIAAQVVVVDYQSGADWTRLADQHSFTLVEKEGPINDFAAERNNSLDKCSQSWVLFLDSDEVLDPSSVEELAKIIADNRHSGILVNRKDFFHQRPLKYGEAGQTKLLRLGKKSEISFDRPVHETATVNQEPAKSRIQLLHQAHPSISKFLSKISRYAQLEAKYRHTLKPNYPNWLITLQLLAFPGLKFGWNFLGKLGWLDGWRGLVYATMMSLHSLLVRVYWWELKKA